MGHRRMQSALETSFYEKKALTTWIAQSRNQRKRSDLPSRNAPSAGTERINRIEKCHSGLCNSNIF